MKPKKSIILTADFFNNETHEVAKKLLGKVLYRREGNKLYRSIISETEAYHSMQDLACHCSKGITPRTKIMFDQPGHIYVYLIYGMYHMLNFVTMPKGFPAAILVRGIKDLTYSDDNGQTFKPLNVLTNGPGKLTKQLKIDKSFNGLEVKPENNLWVADENIKIAGSEIKSGPRIGIAYAKEWVYKPWRFWL